MSLAAFIVSQRDEHAVPAALACRALGVSQAWFYKWRHGDVSLRRARRMALDAAVAWLFRRRGGRDGSPPITAALHDLGWKISKNTVAASMRSQGLVARPKKKRRGLTRADRRARKAPDLLKRDFAPPPAVNQRWVSDLTEIPTGEGTLYLASILDLNSRRCVGYALGVHHDADLAAAALCVAIAVRGGDVAGVVFHTDQGRGVHRRRAHEGLREGRDRPVDGSHRVGAGQRRRGGVPLHDRVRVALPMEVRHPGRSPSGRGGLAGGVQHRPVAFDQRPDHPGRLRARPTPTGRETVRPAAPSRTSSTTPGRRAGSEQPSGSGFAARNPC